LDARLARLRPLLLDVDDLEPRVRLVEHRGFHRWPPGLAKKCDHPTRAGRRGQTPPQPTGLRLAAVGAREGSMEAFQPGELVALTGAPGDTRGRVVDVSGKGRTVDARWELRHGHEHAVTTEQPRALRRVH